MGVEMIYKQFEERVKVIPYNPESRIDYHHAINKCNLAFKSALESEYDTEHSDKKDLLWQLVWEDTHSSGYHECELKYSEYCELIND